MKSVICTFCNSEIYRYKGPETKLELKAEHFEPIALTETPPKSGDAMSCPACKSKFIGASLQNKQVRMLVSSAYYGSGNVGNL